MGSSANEHRPGAYMSLGIETAHMYTIIIMAIFYRPGKFAEFEESIRES